MFKHKSNKASKAAAKQQPVFKQDYFNNCHRTYSCIHCRAHLANHDELISKLFQGNHGRAYLFNKVVNIGCKQAVQRELLTGLHAVADIYCDNCGTTLGWKYEQAFVASQKYKEGKYIIELVHMLKENDWDLTSYNARELLLEAQLPETKQSLAYYSFQFIGDKYIGRNSSNIRQYTRASSGRIADKSRMIEMTPVISRSPMSQQATNTATTTTTTTTTTKTVTTTLEVVEGGNTEKDQDSETNRSVREKQSPLYENSKGESSENSKTIATTTTSFIEATSLGRLEIKIISDDIEQLGSSIGDHETSKTGENSGNNISSLSTSPKDSICSSRSQSSEASSYISATDSGSSSTDD